MVDVVIVLTSIMYKDVIDLKYKEALNQMNMLRCAVNNLEDTLKRTVLDNLMEGKS